MNSALTDEEKKLQQRLVFKESQLKKFTSKLIEYMASFKSLSVEESETYIKSIIAELETLEFQIYKAEVAHYVSIQDKEYHKAISEEIDSSIERTKNDIENLNQLISLEREKNNYKQDYEVLSKSICQYEEGAVLERKLKSIEDEISEVERKYQEQKNLMEMKSKQLHLILSATTEFMENPDNQIPDVK